ncbi:family 43 glycosylhydrolase [Herbiconiux sp. A18JL235]|uniref:beta-fructofuranosidase n=1 Tax=Herbiconiux sp. A18JL235 TaxID=3152363 RepID=A0AB39BGV0_9MICO
MSPSTTTSPAQTRAFARFADGLPVGDVIPFWHDGTYHLFILTPPASTLHYPERLLTTWRHITSTDLIDWTELPPAIAPGDPAEADGGGIWTGSVIEADGLFHIFYTAHASDSLQAICHATSPDGITWEKDPANPISRPDPSRFESNDWRDPFVFWNAEEQRYWMLITARSLLANAASRGVVAFATSTDLTAWSEFEIFYDTFLTHAPECPEVFRLGDSWVLGYSRFTDRRGTVYRVSESLSGPWRSFGAEGPDAANWYAAKGLSDATGRRIAFGWVPDHDPELRDPANPWLWAGDLALPRELRLDERGRITMHMPVEVEHAIGSATALTEAGGTDNWSSIAGRGIQGNAIGTVATRVFESAEASTASVFSATFDDVDDSQLVGVVVHTNEMVDHGVGIYYYPRIHSIRAVDMKAPAGKVTAEYESMFGQYAPVAEHDLTGPLEGPVEFRVVIRGDVVEAFVGEACCLTFRSKGAESTHAAVVVVDGDARVSDISWRRFG